MKLTPYLLFDGTAREAMHFYQSVFGGDLSLTTVGDSPMRASFPVEAHERVVNARLSSAIVDLSASDWLHPTERPLVGNTICLYLSQGTVAETRAVFQKLAQKAKVTDPLGDQPFGVYGAMNDDFGVRWMFHAVPMDQ